MMLFASGASLNQFCQISRKSLIILSALAACACDSSTENSSSSNSEIGVEAARVSDHGPPVDRPQMLGEIIGETPGFVRTFEYDRRGGGPVIVRSYSKSESLSFEQTIWPNGDERLERTDREVLIGSISIQAPDCEANDPLPVKILPLLRPDKRGLRFPEGSKWDTIDPVTWDQIRRRACGPYDQEQQQAAAEEARKRSETDRKVELAAQEAQLAQDKQDQEDERLIEAVRRRP